MKKRLLALLLYGALSLAALPVSFAAFTDISDETTALAAASLQGLGVVSGTGGTSFSPNSSLTRAQLCTMVVNALGLGDQVSSYARKTLFSDIPSSAWYNGYVNLAYSQGLINGYGDGTFGPDDTVTYGQAAAILLRMLGYTTQEIGSVWPADYTAFAASLGLSDGLSLGDNQGLTRGQAAVLLYRALKSTVSGSDKACYETVSGVTSTQEVILLDADASYGGGSGLLMVYSLSGSADGIVYYIQKNTQSDALEGYAGTLLFNSAGQAVGFIPQEGGWEDVTVKSAAASGFTASDGTTLRVSGDTVVVSGGSVYPYSTTGYLQLESWSGKSVRLYYDDNGAILCICLAGGTAASSQAAVASTSSLTSLARQLGISGKSYAVTKNGAPADETAAAQYDAGYYDAASNTLRLSDYRVTGYLSAASPNVAAAQTVTVAGCTLQVLESAWDTLEDFSLGSKVTLLLTDDGKVAAAYTASQLSADMVGVLSRDGRSVTLSGSGLVLSAGTMSYDDSALGSLVQVTASATDTLRCTALSSKSGASSLDLEAGTMGSLDLAPSCAIYEWTGSGYVYDLEGNAGSASSDFDAITWTDSLSASCVSYYHTNSAGQVDVLLLDDVTGNCYDYGRISLYSGQEGINLGSGTMAAYNSAAALTNASGTTGKYLCSLSVSGGSYVGISLGQHSSGYTKVTAIRTLSKAAADRSDFFLDDGSWYVEVNGTELPVSGQVEIYLDSADTWLSGEEGLTAALADGYSLTLYYDRAPNEGGQIRLITAE